MEPSNANFAKVNQFVTKQSQYTLTPQNFIKDVVKLDCRKASTVKVRIICGKVETTLEYKQRRKVDFLKKHLMRCLRNTVVKKDFQICFEDSPLGRDLGIKTIIIEQVQPDDENEAFVLHEDTELTEVHAETCVRSHLEKAKIQNFIGGMDEQTTALTKILNPYLVDLTRSSLSLRGFLISGPSGNLLSF